MLERGYTPLFEYVAPDNQVVLKYDKPELILLACRNIKTGEYMSSYDLGGYVGMYCIKAVEELPKMDEDVVKALDETEGIVCVVENKTRFKIKTDWYVTRHHLKDNINTEFKIITLIVNEELDDAIALFGEGLFDMEYITQLQKDVSKEYNHQYNVCTMFYEDNFMLTQKEYAIKAKESITGPFFNFVMMTYVKKECDFKETYLRFKKKECKELKE